MEKENKPSSLKAKNHKESSVKQADKVKENPSNDIKKIIKDKDLKALSAHLKDGIKSYYKSDTFKNFLSFVSKFHRYSEQNIRLIQAQNPDAQYIASFNKWKELKNPVKKGGKATWIYAPIQIQEKDNEGKVKVDDNGEPIKFIMFKLVHVFADTETMHPELLPQPVTELLNDLDDHERFLKLYHMLEEISPVPITLENIPDGAQGYFDPVNQRIGLLKGMGEEMTLKVMVHEITHSMLHQNLGVEFGSTQYTKQEFEAESVAYIVSNHLGIDASSYSFGYLANWVSGKHTVDEFESSLAVITKQSQNLIQEIEKTYEKVFVETKPENKFEERLSKISEGKKIVPDKKNISSNKPSEKEDVPPKKNSPLPTR